MSATAYDIPAGHTATPPEHPDAGVVGRFIDARDISELTISGQPTRSSETVGTGSDTRGADPPRRPWTCEQDADGVFVVQDLLGAVYGAGMSFDEAYAEFEAALADHARFLRERADALHPRLRQELAALERMFPGL